MNAKDKKAKAKLERELKQFVIRHIYWNEKLTKQKIWCGLFPDKKSAVKYHRDHAMFGETVIIPQIHYGFRTRFDYNETKL